MGGGKATDKVTVRMNYNLNEESYNMLQLSEGYITRLCSLLDELLEPLRAHLAPRLWDSLLLTVIGTAAKRLETSLRRCHVTALGALTLDSDMRDLLSYTKERMVTSDYASNLAVTRSCLPLGRLLQISKLLNVDELDDVLDLISTSKRKGHWDLKLEDAKAFLCQRVEFESSRVNELLRLPSDDD
jgi:conserved oligomeric Golgi complex subunit 4